MTKMETLLQTLICSPFNYMTNLGVREILTDLYDVNKFFVWVMKK